VTFALPPFQRIAIRVESRLSAGTVGIRFGVRHGEITASEAFVLYAPHDENAKPEIEALLPEVDEAMRSRIRGRLTSIR
jgi:hypothetical protein